MLPLQKELQKTDYLLIDGEGKHEPSHLEYLEAAVDNLSKCL